MKPADPKSRGAGQLRMFTYIIRLRAGSANVAKLPEFFDFMHHGAFFIEREGGQGAAGR
jgi:hypothetical protein